MVVHEHGRDWELLPEACSSPTSSPRPVHESDCSPLQEDRGVLLRAPRASSLHKYLEQTLLGSSDGLTQLLSIDKGTDPASAR